MIGQINNGESGNSSRAKINAVIDIINDYALEVVYDTAANFSASNIVLPERWFGIETDELTTNPKYKICDGLTAWNDLPYAGQKLGLIKIVDLEGSHFTDLSTAKSYINTFFSALPTNVSFDNGVCYFTLPPNTYLAGGGFLNSSKAYIQDPLGLIYAFFAGDSFNNNSGHDHILGNPFFLDYDFQAFSGTVRMRYIQEYLTSGGVVVGYPFAQSSTGKFIFTESFLPNDSVVNNYGVEFFRYSSASIFVRKELLTINSGAIQGDLQQAIANGCNVFFDGAGIATVGDVAAAQSDIDSHKLDTANPHEVTLEQARAEGNSISGDINANSNTIINLKDAINPQEPITKIQFDTYVSSAGGNRGAIDCSANPNYPPSNHSDRWEVTVAGKIGGASGINVDVYDEIVCVQIGGSIGGTQAAVGTQFYIIQGNIERATETTNGYTSYATDAELITGTDNTKSVTSLKVNNFWTYLKTQAQTFSAKITFTTPPRLSSTTAGEYLKVDGNKDLTSVSHIPATDVSEDTTHRFVTDSDKTNWNGKEDSSNKVTTFTGNTASTTLFPVVKSIVDYLVAFYQPKKFSYVDGTLGTVSATNTNTVSKFIKIDANTFNPAVVGKGLSIKSKNRKSGNTSFCTAALYVNTTSNFAGATLLGSINTSGNNTFGYLGLSRNIPIQAGSFNLHTLQSTASGTDDVIASGELTITIDWTNDVYFLAVVKTNVTTPDQMWNTFFSVTEL